MKKISLILLLTVLVLVQVVAQNSENWMSQVNDSKQLSKLSIPGTHDSGSLITSWIAPASSVITQTMSIRSQLDQGIRFLDIRCRHVADVFAIHHGEVFQDMFFGEVLNHCRSFLSSNPSETIIMRVKQEHTSEDNTRTFEATFEDYFNQSPHLWYQGDNLPTLGEARGKIVLLRQFDWDSPNKFGVRASWPDNTKNSTYSHGSLTMHVQDFYHKSNSGNGYLEEKWDAVKEHIQRAMDSESADLYLNFSSGYVRDELCVPLLPICTELLPEIPPVSNYVNPKLSNLLHTNLGKGYGIIIMDFPSHDLIQRIYSNNTFTPRASVYTDCFYTGNHAVLGEGSYSMSTLKQLGIDNNTISAIKVNSDYEMILWESSSPFNFDSKYLSVKSELPCLNKPNAGYQLLDNQLSMLTVRKAPIGVQLFKYYDYVSNSYMPSPSNIYTSDISFITLSNTIGNDALKSLRISPGYEVTLYEHGDFSGESLVLTRDIRKLNDWWSNQVSSIKIRYIGSSRTSVTSALKNDKSLMNLFPNPANKGFTLSIETEQKQNAQVYIRDVSGKLVLTKELGLINGSNQLYFPISDTWHKGLHIIQVITENKEVFSKKLIIE